MNKILEYDLNNFVVKVQCGVLLNDLAEDCVCKGLCTHQIQVKSLLH